MDRALLGATVSQLLPTEALDDPAGSWRSQDDQYNALPRRDPTPLNSLNWREQELAPVRRRLERDDVRLITLTGPGGVGKTRLALAMAADISDAIADSIAFVSLA